MAFEQRELSGALFRNAMRTDENKQPNARGDCLIGGVLYEVSAWTKDGAKGKWQSLSFKVKQDKPAPKDKGQPFSSDDTMPDDGIPF